MRVNKCPRKWRSPWVFVHVIIIFLFITLLASLKAVRRECSVSAFPKVSAASSLLLFDPSLSNSLAISSVKAHYCTDRATVRVPLCLPRPCVVCVCVRARRRGLDKANHTFYGTKAVLWIAGGEAGSRATRKWKWQVLKKNKKNNRLPQKKKKPVCKLGFHSVGARQ